MASQDSKPQQAFSKQQFKVLFDQCLDGILITDPHIKDNPIIYANPAMKNRFGYEPDDLVGKNCRVLQGEDADQSAVLKMREALQREEGCHVELRNYHPDGSMFWNDVTISPLRNANNELVYYLAILRDITHHKDLENTLVSKTMRDPLTGLKTREDFFDFANQQLALADRVNCKLVCVVIDIDNLKMINSHYGHEQGDAAILVAVDQIDETFRRKSDFIARFDGDEFIILVIDVAEEDVMSRLHLLQLKVEQYNAKKNHEWRLSISFGMARYVPGEYDSADELVYAADRKLYQNKAMKDPSLW